MKDKQGSWDLPTYTAPQPSSFSNQYGTSYFKDNTYGTDLSPGTQDYYNQLEGMRKAIYSGLGYTSPAREASLNQWQDTFTKEALRGAQPQLEQSLFARGLGGSKYYQDSLTDLLSKVNTQGVLNREQLSQQDQQMQLNYLASINPEIANILSQQNALAGNTAQQGNLQNQQAWNEYQAMLPYAATWNQPDPTTGQMVGSLLDPGGQWMGYYGNTMQQNSAIPKLLEAWSTIKGTGNYQGAGMNVNNQGGGGYFANVPSYSSGSYAPYQPATLNNLATNYQGQQLGNMDYYNNLNKYYNLGSLPQKYNGGGAF